MTEFTWGNPHCFVRFDVKDKDGGIVHWVAETSNPSEVGKVTTQNPGENTHVAKGSQVKVTLGVQVLGSTENRSQQEAAGASPDLARTGGLFLGGLSLWLLLGGVLARLAGSRRLWRLAGRRG